MNKIYITKLVKIKKIFPFGGILAKQHGRDWGCESFKVLIIN